jgi:hypothetical protein
VEQGNEGENNPSHERIGSWCHSAPLSIKNCNRRGLYIPKAMPGRKLSGSGEKALYRLTPLPARGVTSGDFTGPGTRQVPRWAYQEGELLLGTCVLGLLVEFERFPRGVSTNVEHDEIVHIGLPQKACCGESLGFMHLDSVTSQDGSARLARSPAAVDEENFFARKSRAATKCWAIHRTLPKRARPF